MRFYLDHLDPAHLISANRRIHYRQRADAARYWRALGRTAILTAYGDADPGDAWHQTARIILTFRFPDLRRHDVGNLYPYVAKPLIDGFIDARLLPDDDDKHLTGPDLRRDKTRGPHRITAVIIDPDLGELH